MAKNFTPHTAPRPAGSSPPPMAPKDRPAGQQPQRDIERAPAHELLGETVIVTTPQSIGGQHEHAAIVTCEISDGVVNVMLLPSSGESYAIAGVAPAASGARLHWRHRR